MNQFKDEDVFTKLNRVNGCLSFMSLFRGHVLDHHNRYNSDRYSKLSNHLKLIKQPAITELAKQ